MRTTTAAATAIELFDKRSFARIATALTGKMFVPGSPISFFTRVSGDRVACVIIDISLTGASLKTGTRPPVGEMILIGQMAARVMRQHDRGVAIAFATTS